MRSRPTCAAWWGHEPAPRRRGDAPSGEAPPLSGPDLARFCEFLYARTGMQFGESKRYYIDRRVGQRMVEMGAATFDDYFTRLRADTAELERLINSFTVNETYFYREDHQLKCLSRDMLPDIVSRRGPGDRLRLWSMPCATGEEPYSIAIWLLENWAMVDAYHVEIVGSDIDTRALAEARAGRYAAKSLARLPPELRRDYFLPGEGAGAERFQLIQDLRESVTFTSANLVDGMTLTAQGRFDVIFCRNLLIYFDDLSRRLAVANLYDRLLPGGYLCLGHSESLARLSDRFAVRRFEDAVVYQRPLNSTLGDGAHG
ncbi:protein-glutamate O-methyltransferase CheR [Nitrospirillum sp. BR 11828]|uniref:CheR family methyltransferase n=1 Tax=Nitrospirillum sp. BR 11828 TaxID=3104325 RepID=UPI002ACA5DE3|nr:protein-glutamate O-methyltransferase CheR [Nitrospirillum sp. BR 11828]MDZ5648415.1 protein-glutamate O-methyltransferase CheR [Nitrospirillum sp. BR 11828]